jgi:hypothetical protein
MLLNEYYRGSDFDNLLARSVRFKTEENKDSESRRLTYNILGNPD